MNQFFKVSVFVLAITLFGLLQSCGGTKISEADLDGTWVLTTINNEAVSDAFKGNKPNFELDFEKKTIAGYAGCNRFTGPFTLEDNVFKAGNLATTQMLCVEANKEAEFIATLGNKDGLQISLENNILTFKNGDQIVLQFESMKEPLN